MSAALKKNESSVATTAPADVSNNRSYTILKLPEVIKKTSLARPSVYRQIKAGTFPKPINLGERAVGWVESEVDAWIEKRMHARYADASPSM